MTTTDEPPYAEMINAGLESMLPPAHRMGITITEARVGFAAAEVPVDGNTNHIGTMYAGTLFAVAEILGGAISLASFDAGQFYPTVKDVQIRFRRPARSAVRAVTALDEASIARIQAEAEAVGKAEFVLDAELTDEEGTVVANSHGVYQLRRLGT